eukprot:3437662-Alexandrium_andersonii.AAC.1
MLVGKQRGWWTFPEDEVPFALHARIGAHVHYIDFVTSHRATYSLEPLAGVDVVVASSLTAQLTSSAC